ncbi:MAG TPA: SDR family oxidoreductase [Candidatus Dormibacteraeota bacterium]|jgi:NAD(P)-dependent dehydrogenase (short-subunit alcohol dehydrogenase family)
MDLHQRVAIVTGGGGAGTGRAISRRLAAGGAAVVVADVDGDAGRETVRQVEAAGGRASFLRADVTVEPDVQAMVAGAEETFGGLDVLVNSAGGTPDPHFPDAPFAHWSGTLDLNLRGPMLAIQHALPAMARRGGGAVVNIASVAGVGTIPAMSAEYAAAKAGLIRLTVALGWLAEARGVRVNCVVPDWIATPGVRAHVATLGPDDRVRLPKEMATPEEIADAVADMIGDDSLAGRVLICWCDYPWRLVANGDLGYASATVWRESAPSGPRTAGR